MTFVVLRRYGLPFALTLVVTDLLLGIYMMRHGSDLGARYWRWVTGT